MSLLVLLLAIIDASPLIIAILFMHGRICGSPSLTSPPPTYYCQAELMFNQELLGVMERGKDRDI